MGQTWSPRCHKCGAPANAEVTPPPEKVFAGRLRPDATAPYKFGDRVRCTRCRTWFTLGPGTEWRPNEGSRAHVPEPLPPEGDEGSSTGGTDEQEQAVG